VLLIAPSAKLATPRFRLVGDVAFWGKGIKSLIRLPVSRRDLGPIGSQGIGLQGWSS